jgi:hypothetical protein
MAIGANSIPSPWQYSITLEANMQGATIYILELTFWNVKNFTGFDPTCWKYASVTPYTLAMLYDCNCTVRMAMSVVTPLGGGGIWARSKCPC